MHGRVVLPAGGDRRRPGIEQRDHNLLILAGENPAAIL